MKLETKPCIVCSKPFKQNHCYETMCSDECRTARKKYWRKTWLANNREWRRKYARNLYKNPEVKKRYQAYYQKNRESILAKQRTSVRKERKPTLPLERKIAYQWKVSIGTARKWIEEGKLPT